MLIRIVTRATPIADQVVELPPFSSSRHMVKLVSVNA